MSGLKVVVYAGDLKEGVRGHQQALVKQQLVKLNLYVTLTKPPQAISKKVSGAINKVDEWADNVEGVLMGTPNGSFFYFYLFLRFLDWMRVMSGLIT